jgi:hypothetical protein
MWTNIMLNPDDANLDAVVDSFDVFKWTPSELLSVSIHYRIFYAYGAVEGQLIPMSVLSDVFYRIGFTDDVCHHLIKVFDNYDESAGRDNFFGCVWSAIYEVFQEYIKSPAYNALLDTISFLCK